MNEEVQAYIDAVAKCGYNQSITQLKGEINCLTNTDVHAFAMFHDYLDRCVLSSIIKMLSVLRMMIRTQACNSVAYCFKRMYIHLYRHQHRAD